MGLVVDKEEIKRKGRVSRVGRVSWVVRVVGVSSKSSRS